MYLGAHFRVDVAAGAGLGLFIGSALNPVFGVPSASTAGASGYGEMVPRTSTPETSPPAPFASRLAMCHPRCGHRAIGTETASAGPSGCPAWPTLNP
jgi:hypothetical protein